GGEALEISVVGAGYVGLVTGLCLSEMGHSVTLMEVLEDRVERINRGELPIFERDLDDLLERHLGQRFRATTEMGEIVDTELTFICVGTPSREDGGLDLSHVERAAEEIGSILSRKDGYHLVVVKSTLVPGTTRNTLVPLLEDRSGKRAGEDFGVGVNPEFLREGEAVGDFMHPDRVIVGGIDDASRGRIASLFEGLDAPVLQVSLSTAEMIKMASNAFLATKISFINEIGNMCKEIGIDVREVAQGMGHDPRIGPHFLQAGAGFGGSCFPKDLRGLAAESSRRGIPARICRAVEEVNEAQPLRLVELLERHLELAGARIGVLGLAFKPGTDDVRESRSVSLVNALLERGARVGCHDPQAVDNFKGLFPTLEYHERAEDCVNGSDAVVLMTEWEEYSDPEMYGDTLVLDGRGVVRTKNYEGICW
ncbi:MAG: UDP-glucose dehydrogenase family protein, partial [Methanomassiliicoccales archaeon]